MKTTKFVKIVILFTFWGVITMTGSSAFSQDNSVSFTFTPHHIALSVPNAEESAAWYKIMLGFEVVMRMNEDSVNTMKVVHISSGDAYIELFEVAGAKPLPDYRRDPSTDFTVHGLKHFAFTVTDVMAAIKELREKGAEIVMEPQGGRLFGFVRDNAGNCFELIQYSILPGSKTEPKAGR